jgi:hypothetical protein
MAARRNLSRAELLRVAEAHGFSGPAIAGALGVSLSTVYLWNARGWLTPTGQRLLEYRSWCDLQQRIATLRAVGGDLHTAAEALHLSKWALQKSLLKARLFARALAPRACVVCGRPFQSRHSQAQVCGSGCRAVRKRERTAASDQRRKLRRLGEARYDLRGRELHEPITREALVASHGQFARAAAIAGVTVNTIQYRVRAWGLQYVVDNARRIYSDPERMAALLAELDDSIPALCRHMGRSQEWLRRTLVRLNARHVTAEAPCLQCGRRCPRVRGKRAFCGRACRQERQNGRRRRQYHARRAAACPDRPDERREA